MTTSTIEDTTLLERATPHASEGAGNGGRADSRLFHAHEIVLKQARTMARLAAERGDDGTNDLIVSDVTGRNERQV
jgi:starvation-inducible DNA-binding protein